MIEILHTTNELNLDRLLNNTNLVWHIDNNSYFLLVLLFCELACVLVGSDNNECC
jgi:hypothetical protein